MSKNIINISSYDKNLKSPNKSKTQVFVKEKSPRQETKIISINKVVTVDLTREGNKEKRFSKQYINTKVVNLDLYSSSESTLSSKNLNHCKSENLIEFNDNPTMKKKKYIHVPTVETKLYSDQSRQDSNENQISRNSSLSLKNARSNKRKLASSTNESMNESQDSQGEKFNINSLNLQLNEIKSINKLILQKEERSVSPMTVNQISESTKQRGYSTEPVRADSEKRSSEILTFQPNKNMSFLNYVRLKRKKE
jgi:hypothetical protein